MRQISRLQNVYTGDSGCFHNGKQSSLDQDKLPERKRRWIRLCSNLPSPPSIHAFCNPTEVEINCYARDVQSRLKNVTYPGSGNNSQFTYDGLGQCVKIVETVSSSITSTKQFIWCKNERCEERDGSGALTGQFYGRGEKISGTSYFYSKDHLGSIREMTNGAGTIVWQQSFDPCGLPTTLVSTTPADFGYAGYYLHQRSGLNLTMYRAYSSTLGRWISRDPAGENIGTNLYAYCFGDPINLTDPSGQNPLLVWFLANAPEIVFWSIAVTEAFGPPGTSSVAGISCPVKSWLPPPTSWKPDFQKYLAKTGWTFEQITEAIESGQGFPVNKTNWLNPGNQMTRFVNPTTGQSVIQDNVTREVIHLGGPGSAVEKITPMLGPPNAATSF